MGWVDRKPNTEVGWYRLDNLVDKIGLSKWKNNPEFARMVRQGSRYQLSAGYNSPNPSYTWGFELEHQMNFRFLPVSWLQNITLTYNVSIARSETNLWMEKTVVDTQYNAAVYNSRGQLISPEGYTKETFHTEQLYTKPMEAQPQLTSNVSLGYDVEQWGSSVRISMFYQGKYTRIYSSDGTSDGIVGEFIKWDLSLKQQITSKISLMLNVDNLFNRTETRYRYNNFAIFNWGYLPTAESSYGTTIDLGVRVSL
jgi:outer membrane receptor protein involved in Fe transport